jgi:hypothetical protein
MMKRRDHNCDSSDLRFCLAQFKAFSAIHTVQAKFVARQVGGNDPIARRLGYNP